MWFEEEGAEVIHLSDKCFCFKMLELKTAIFVVTISKTSRPSFVVVH